MSEAQPLGTLCGPTLSSFAWKITSCVACVLNDSSTFVYGATRTYARTRRKKKEVEELVRNGVKKEFSPHFRVFLNNARTRSGEREGLIFFYRSVKREGREKLFMCFWPRKTKTTNSDPPRELFFSSSFFLFPFFLSFFLSVL